VLLNGLWLQVAISLLVLGYCLLFIYADKVILYFMGSREIIESDSHQLFQAFKSVCFHHKRPVPKVYVYPGNLSKFFVFESRYELTVVLSSQSYDELSESEIYSLAKFAIDLSDKNRAWFLTKGMMLSAVALKAVYELSSLFSTMKLPSHFSRFVKIVGLFFLRPYVEMVGKISRIKNNIEADESLKRFYYKCIQGDQVQSFSEFVLRHMVGDPRDDENLLRYIESFPIIERAQFE
jgi:hypothetical protein